MAASPLSFRFGVLVVAFALACSKARTSESPARVSEPPVGAQATGDAAPFGGAPGQDVGDAAALAGTGGEPALGVQLTPSNESDVESLGRGDPVGALNAQLKGGGTAQRPMSALAIVKSHRALDSSSVSSGEVMLKFVREGKATVRHCYERLRAREPSATGTMTLRFAISATGNVVDPTAESWHADLSKCVLEAMSRWRFPAPKTQARFELVLSLVTG
ncbi:MAG: AgmX/PglI C-terminal domain-containing protein [Kofleriaceae bacterium]